MTFELILEYKSKYNCNFIIIYLVYHIVYYLIPCMLTQYSVKCEVEIFWSKTAYFVQKIYTLL